MTLNTTRYKLFLGYDPGGKDKHGVAAVRVAADGTFGSDPETCTLQDAEEVCRWAGEHKGEAVALGIDTLLAWSLKGKRKVDDALRKHYPEQGQTVIAQNSLYSSMTVNGVLVARHGYYCLGLPLLESHPKLVTHRLQEDPSATEILCWQKKLVANPHEADALVAAWCASRWVFKCWRIDLYTTVEDDGLVFPAGPASYPWPNAIVTGRESCTPRHRPCSHRLPPRPPE